MNAKNISVTSRKIFYIDHAKLHTTLFFFANIVIFFLFQKGDVITGRAFFPSAPDKNPNMLNFTVIVDSFTELQKDIEFFITAKRSNRWGEEKIPLGLFVNIVQMNFIEVIKEVPIANSSEIFEFLPEAEVSKAVKLANITFNPACNYIKVFVVLNCELKKLIGVDVTWFSKAAPNKMCIKLLQVILPLISIYLSVCYFNGYEAKSELFIHYCLKIIGSISVLTSIPLSFILGTSIMPRYFQFYTSLILAAFLRYFATILLQHEIEHKVIPNNPINYLLSAYFSIDLLLSFLVGTSFVSETIISGLVFISSVMYLIITVGLIARGIMKSSRCSRTLVFSILLQILFVGIKFNYESYTSLISVSNELFLRYLTYGALNIFVSSFLLVYYQQYSQQNWEQMQENPKIYLDKDSQMSEEIIFGPTEIYAEEEEEESGVETKEKEI